MCPDRQMISFYSDGELPSPWKEKLETHLESCEKCRAILAGYRSLSSNLRDEPKNLESSLDRVWERLSSLDKTSPEINESRTRQKTQWPIRSIWQKNVTLPLPVAAAAVLVFAVFFALIGIRGLTRPAPADPIAAIGIGLDDLGMIPIQDMTGVLQYLSSQDMDFMVIPLPEMRNFPRIGEPALINAADYPRRSGSR